MNLKDKVLSLEMSKKLLEAGITIETERAWVLFKGPFPPMIKPYGDLRRDDGHIAAVIPAPDMHELWEALPDSVVGRGAIKEMTPSGVWYRHNVMDNCRSTIEERPMIEQLASLLLWVRANYTEATEGK